jgi:hypothetical protein
VASLEHARALCDEGSLPCATFITNEIREVRRTHEKYAKGMTSDDPRSTMARGIIQLSAKHAKT